MEFELILSQQKVWKNLQQAFDGNLIGLNKEREWWRIKTNG